MPQKCHTLTRNIIHSDHIKLMQELRNKPEKKPRSSVDAEIVRHSSHCTKRLYAAKVQKFIFFHTTLARFYEICHNNRILRSGRLQHAGGQDRWPILSCDDFHNSPTLWTERRTDE